MKTTFIAFSLLTNLVLAGLLTIPTARERVLSFGGSQPAAATSHPGAPANPATKAGTPSAGGATLGAGALSPEEARRFVESARAAGMPDEAIRALLQVRAGEAYTALRKSLVQPATPVPYWKTQLGPLTTLSPDAASQLRQLSQANGRLITDLLGPDPLAIVSPYEKLQYGNLPADKIDQLKLIVQDYNDLSSGARQGGILLPEDRAKLAFFDGEKDKDIRALLTPDEYEEYQFRTSSTANSMRSNLALFEPSEQEFRAIFPLQQAFDQKFNPSNGPLPPEMQRQRAAAQQQLTADVQAALDPVRAADYEKATDYNYKSVMQIVNRLDLPKDVGTTVWQTQKDAQAQAAAIRGAGLPMDARIAQLTDLQTRATTAIQGALGDRGFDNYKQSGGTWLTTLVPQIVVRGGAAPAGRGVAVPARGGP